MACFTDEMYRSIDMLSVVQSLVTTVRDTSENETFLGPFLKKVEKVYKGGGMSV